MGVVNRTGTVKASGAVNASGNLTVENFQHAESVSLTLDVTAFSGTTPTLNVVVQYEDPASGKFVTIGTFTQVGAATATETITLTGVLAPSIRISWTLGGTNPNYTFSIGMRVKDNLA